MNELTWYLAGPMSGYPKFNFPLFHEAAANLRSKGYKVISPAELDSEAIQAEAIKSKTGKIVDGKIAGETMGQILGRDVTVIIDQVKGIIFLTGWEQSRGARLEAFVGLSQGHKFATYHPHHGIQPIDAEFIRDAVYSAASLYEARYAAA